jgi:hypothetical protein
MHVHSNLLDTNLQLDAAYAAAKAEAKAEAERTRKKLLSAAPALGGESDDAADCVVRLSEDARQEQQARQQDRDDQGSSKQNQPASPDPPTNAFSDWA